MKIPAREFWRKSVHFAGIFFIPLLLWRREVFTGLVLIFLSAYLLVELRAKKGLRTPLLSEVAARSKRESERGTVSMGAILLAATAVVLPYLLGPWAAAVGLSQVFVADVPSTLVGIRWGEKKLPFSAKKSWAGSLSYLAAAFLIGLPFVPIPKALVLALLGTFIEALPFPHIDNLTIPLGVGTAAFFLL